MKSEEQLEFDNKQTEIILKELPKISLQYFAAANKFKSVNRAIRRGNVTDWGLIIPKKPFNNRANTSERKGVHSRVHNENKKAIYAELRKYGKRFELFN